jgi:dimethylhistidine N-methyltransferase
MHIQGYVHVRPNPVNLAINETGNNFLDDVLEGLQQKPKRLDAKYFYDETGSELYDEICRLPEYYPYRAELSILPSVAEELSTNDIHEIVEFGAGSLHKIKALLSGIQTVRRFIPIDISAEHLNNACRQLRVEFGQIDILPLVGDFAQLRELPQHPRSKPEGDDRLGFFPGSTIGNFGPAEATDLLQRFRFVLGEGAQLVIGVDQKKAAGLLHHAYNDAQDITASFNLNLLRRINRELQADFDIEWFEHYAFYNPLHGRVEMHLVSKARQKVRVADHVFTFERGESIHTENSYKYSQAEFRRMAENAGWKIKKSWVDENDLFAVYLIKNFGEAA